MERLSALDSAAEGTRRTGAGHRRVVQRDAIVDAARDFATAWRAGRFQVTLSAPAGDPDELLARVQRLSSAIDAVVTAVEECDR